MVQRRLRVCRECVVKRAQAKQAKTMQWRATFQIDGRMVRRCSGCHEVKDLESAFQPQKRDEDGIVTHYKYLCDECIRVAGAKTRERIKADAVRLARKRDMDRKAKRRRRATRPEAVRATQRRWLESLEPERRAVRRENQRMEYRLRRERDGVNLESIRRVRPRKETPDDRMAALPALPLATAIEAAIARERTGMFGADDIEARERVCRRAQTDTRSLFAWRTGERQMVQFDTAERALVGLDLLWWQIWDPEEFPEVADTWEREVAA